MDVSIVIGSYNQCDRLTRVIDAYKQQITSCNFELIVVDSLSDDGTQEMLASVPSKLDSFHFKFVSKENPSGKAQARNHGVYLSNSDLIIISDADMIPDVGFVQAHVDAHSSASQPCCFEGLAHNLVSYDWPPNLLLATPQVPKKYQTGARLQWYYFLTGNISFPKSIFEQASGFSLDFKNYGWEDLEFGYRLFKQKVPFYYLKEAINYHYHVISDDEQIDRKYNMGQSAQIFYQKHPELKWFLGLNPVSAFLRRRLSKQGVLYRMIASFYGMKIGFLHRFSVWFLSEYNYLSGILNLKK